MKETTKLKAGIKVVNALVVTLVLLFVVGFFATYIHDYLDINKMFGDYKGIGMNNKYGDVWGARHYWYTWGCLILFLLSLIRIVILCRMLYLNYTTKHI